MDGAVRRVLRSNRAPSLLSFPRPSAISRTSETLQLFDPADQVYLPCALALYLSQIRRSRSAVGNGALIALAESQSGPAYQNFTTGLSGRWPSQVNIATFGGTTARHRSGSISKHVLHSFQHHQLLLSCVPFHNLHSAPSSPHHHLSTSLHTYLNNFIAAQYPMSPGNGDGPAAAGGAPSHCIDQDGSVKSQTGPHKTHHDPLNSQLGPPKTRDSSTQTIQTTQTEGIQV